MSPGSVAVDNPGHMNDARHHAQGPECGQRLDKWLWAARLYKTRALAAAEADRGRVLVNGQAVKPARTIRPGDRLELRQGGLRREFVVRALAVMRRPAPEAQGLYEETAASVEARQRAAEARRQGIEPALARADGRPTKRERRDLADWQRWSVDIDDPPRGVDDGPQA